MAEQSGEAFTSMMNRDRAYIKLANYIAHRGQEMTHADLMEDLPFYKGSEVQKREMLNLAIAHGYKNGIYIRRDLIDGIEFISGKSVPETDLNKMIVAASTEITTSYSTHYVSFDKIHCLTNKKDYHWVTHALKDGYRDEVHVIPGCNVVCLDVENSSSINAVKLLLKDFKYLLHTTKRHTEKAHRFRVILPLSHTLELDGKDYRDFMNNIFDWLPFDVDRQTAQRSRKWLTHNGDFWYNDGLLLDALQFVPKTKKAEEHRAIVAGQTNLSALERWFINNTQSGGRNNSLIRYAYALIDMGQDIASIQNNILALNTKLQTPLEESEVLNTIIPSMIKKFHSKGT